MWYHDGDTRLRLSGHARVHVECQKLKADVTGIVQSDFGHGDLIVHLKLNDKLRDFSQTHFTIPFQTI